MASLVTKLYQGDKASYDKLFDQSEFPILILTFGNYIKYIYPQNAVYQGRY